MNQQKFVRFDVAVNNACLCARVCSRQQLLGNRVALFIAEPAVAQCLREAATAELECYPLNLPCLWIPASTESLVDAGVVEFVREVERNGICILEYSTACQGALEC
jgi:hypothetical protein